MFIVAQQLKFVLGVIANSNIGIKIQFLAVTNLFLRKHVSSINSNVGWIKDYVGIMISNSVALATFKCY